MKYHGHGLSMVTQSTAPVSPCSDDAIAVSAVGRPTHVRVVYTRACGPVSPCSDDAIAVGRPTHVRVVNVLLIVLSRTSMPLNRRLRERT